MAKVAPTRTPDDLSRDINARLAEKPKRVVKQRDLEDLAEKMERASELAAEVKALKEDIEKAELVIAHAIENGGSVERGDLAAAVTVTPGQVRPKWKEEFAAVAGPVAVETVIGRTLPSADTKHVVLSRKGVAL